MLTVESIIMFFIGVFFGMVIAALLTGGGRAEIETEISYWRNQYFTLKNGERKDAIWQNLFNKTILETTST